MERSDKSAKVGSPIKNPIKSLGKVIKSILPNPDEEEEDGPSGGAGDLLSLKLSLSDLARIKKAKQDKKKAKKAGKHVRNETRAENVRPQATTATAKAPAQTAPPAFRKISIPDRASPQQARNDNLVSGIKLAANALSSPPKGAQINTAANALNFAIKPLKATLKLGQKGPGQSPSAPKRTAAGPRMGR